MKLRFILSALVAGAMASPNDRLPNHEIDALLARAIDPSTMDPVRLSVLSVLRTAMPTGPGTTLPTGNVEPDWYKKLPQDVKNLLPSLYPATKKAAAATPTSVMAYPSASSSVTPSPSATSPCTTSTHPPTSKASKANVPSYTASANYSVPTARPANATLPTGSTPPAPPLPSQTFSTGTKTAIRLETLTALMWLGVGAGFMIFA